MAAMMPERKIVEQNKPQRGKYYSVNFRGKKSKSRTQLAASLMAGGEQEEVEEKSPLQL